MNALELAASDYLKSLGFEEGGVCPTPKQLFKGAKQANIHDGHISFYNGAKSVHFCKLEDLLRQDNPLLEYFLRK